jgi:cation diffusion facilitator CzcD-associated flavoprotein CzcO
MNNTIYDQVIIGAGFAGLCMGIKLKEAGMHNFVILERNDHIGGTWYDNAYPGAACDVESHLYSFSFEPKPDWSRQFGPQAEILQYIDHCANKYELNPHIQLSTSVAKAIFDEASGLWTVTTEAGQTLQAKSVISCSGGLSQPSYPDIKGLDTFKGKLFHSARWDKNYDISGKQVAVIGTGASAIQIVPAIASTVKELVLFQRTPPWILPKPDKEISPLRKWLYTNIPFTRSLYRTRLYWQHELMAIGFVVNPKVMKFAERLSLSYLDRKVKDETLKKKLTPNYRIGCKRILLTNNYYPALQRPNVSVITEPIKELNEIGVCTNDGKQYEVDAVILATGFQAAENVSRYEVRGLKGQDLNEAWHEGAEAYLGTTVSGFPNMYLIVGPNTGLGHSSMILMIEAQVNYVMGSLKAMKKKDAKYLNLKNEEQQRFNKDIQEKLTKTIWQTGGCVSWYQMKNGKNVTLWPGFTFSFMQQTKNFDIDKYQVVK